MSRTLEFVIIRSEDTGIFLIVKKVMFVFPRGKT